MRRRRIVTLEQVSDEQQHLTRNCFYCFCPKHPKEVKAVRAVECETDLGSKLYIGICGNHAEVYPLTEEDKKRASLRCPQCFPRL